MDMSGAHRLLMCLFCLLNNVLISYCKSVLLKMRHDKRKTCFWKKIAFIYLFIFCFFFFQWGLICDKNHLKALTQAAYLAGLLVGSYAFSSISDHLGRRVAVFLSIAILVSASRNDYVVTRFTIYHKKKGNNLRLSQFQAVCGTVSAVADCLSLFALFRVGAGAAAAGCLLSRFVYCMELSVTSNRTAAGFVSNIFMTVGYAILALLAYLMRDWRHLMLAVSVPGVLLLLFWW